MRFTILLSLMLVAFVSAVGAESSDPYAYSVSVVRSALANRTGETRIINSWNQKGLLRLGDAVSVALIKILDEANLRNPLVVRDFLPIVRDAFERPELISEESDRQPKVTLFFLECLRETVGDPETQQAIRETIAFVKGRVSK